LALWSSDSRAVGLAEFTGVDGAVVGAAIEVDVSSTGRAVVAAAQKAMAKVRSILICMGSSENEYFRVVESFLDGLFCQKVVVSGQSGSENMEILFECDVVNTLCHSITACGYRRLGWYARLRAVYGSHFYVCRASPRFACHDGHTGMPSVVDDDFITVPC
jgi:hypothetical protein